MMFVFDKELHTVSNEDPRNTGFYYEKMQYMSNIAGGLTSAGILGWGSLFIDIFKSKTPYETILTDDIVDETDLLYLIEPWPMFNGLNEKKGLENIRKPRNWHRTLDFVPRKILQLAKDRRLTILLHIPEFATGLDLIIQNLNTTIQHLEIPESQFKFISGIKHPSWYYWPGFEYSQTLGFDYGDSPVASVNLEQRNKKFTCLNRIDRVHRRYLAVNLWKRGLAELGYFSYSFGKYAFTEKGYKLVKSEWDIEPPHYDATDWDFPDEWKKFYDSGPWTADALRPTHEHNNHLLVNKQHYNDSYWNFVTETSSETVPFLTEKTFKPIANLQPFVMFGGKHTLSLLHDLGYKTFGNYIDETYDKIDNRGARIKAATQQAINLAQMSHADHIALTKQIKPIAEHNQRHFFNSKNRIVNFVKYINGNDPAYNWLKDCKYS